MSSPGFCSKARSELFSRRNRLVVLPCRARFTVFCLSLLLVGVHRLYSCAIDWNYQPDRFEGVDSQGYASHWISLGELNFGNDLVIPLAIHYSSQRSPSPSLYVGESWTFPFVESRFIARDEQTFTLMEPSGRARMFRRDEASPFLLHGQGGWLGEIAGSQVTLWAPCGWKFVYEGGKLSQMTSHRGRTLKFICLDGVLSTIQENGLPILRLSRLGKSLLITTRRLQVAFTFDASMALSAVKEGEQRPKLVRLKTDVSGSQTDFQYQAPKNGRFEFTVSKPEGQIKRFVMDSSSRRLLADSDWIYTVKAAADSAASVTVERSRANGEKEGFSVDRAKGEKSLLQNGVLTTTRLIKSGPFAGSVKEIERASQGETATKTQFEYSRSSDGGLSITELRNGEFAREHLYNSRGNLLRETYSDGKTITYHK